MRTPDLVAATILTGGLFTASGDARSHDGHSDVYTITGQPAPTLSLNTLSGDGVSLTGLPDGTHSTQLSAATYFGSEQSPDSLNPSIAPEYLANDPEEILPAHKEVIIEGADSTPTKVPVFYSRIKPREANAVQVDDETARKIATQLGVLPDMHRSVTTTYYWVLIDLVLAIVAVCLGVGAYLQACKGVNAWNEAREKGIEARAKKSAEMQDSLNALAQENASVLQSMRVVEAIQQKNQQELREAMKTLAQKVGKQA